MFMDAQTVEIHQIANKAWKTRVTHCVKPPSTILHARTRTQKGRREMLCVHGFGFCAPAGVFNSDQSLFAPCHQSSTNIMVYFPETGSWGTFSQKFLSQHKGKALFNRSVGQTVYTRVLYLLSFSLIVCVYNYQGFC